MHTYETVAMADSKVRGNPVGKNSTAQRRIIGSHNNPVSNISSHVLILAIADIADKCVLEKGRIHYAVTLHKVTKIYNVCC